MTNEELAVKAKQGDQDAMLKLWEQVEQLVRKLARRRLPADGHTSRFDIDDLMQAGYIAVTQAVQAFDPEKEFLFTTYLHYHLKTAFASELGIHTTRRDALLSAVSINAPTGADDGDGSLTLESTLEAMDTRYTIDDRLDCIAEEQAFAVVMGYVERLEPSERAVIEAYYLRGLNFRETGLAIGIAPQEVRKLLQKAMRHLRGVPEIRQIGQELYRDEHTNFWLHVGIEACLRGGSAVERLADRRGHV